MRDLNDLNNLNARRRQPLSCVRWGFALAFVGLLTGQAGEPRLAFRPTNWATLSNAADVPPIRVALNGDTNVPTGLTSPVRIRHGTLHRSIESVASRRRFGCSLAVADINGDGFVDFFVGQSRGAGTRNPGAVFAFHGTVDGLSSSPPDVIQGLRPRDLFGLSLANVGDVNGDGLAEVSVGAPDYANGQVREGAFFLAPRPIQAFGQRKPPLGRHRPVGIHLLRTHLFFDQQRPRVHRLPTCANKGILALLKD